VCVELMEMTMIGMMVWRWWEPTNWWWSKRKMREKDERAKAFQLSFRQTND